MTFYSRKRGIVSIFDSVNRVYRLSAAACQTTHTLYIQLYDGGRQTGREGGTEGARQDGGWEGVRGEWGGREQREGVMKRYCEGGWEREWRKGGKLEERNE